VGLGSRFGVESENSIVDNRLINDDENFVPRTNKRTESHKESTVSVEYFNSNE
jgi:hypothetical protein